MNFENKVPFLCQFRTKGKLKVKIVLTTHESKVEEEINKDFKDITDFEILDLEV